VNTSGKPGRNKPADMQQENNIKFIKTVFKGMGAGKTDAALVRASKAAPAVSRMAAKFQNDFAIKLPARKFESYQKKTTADKLIVRGMLEKLHPFRFSASRKIGKKMPSSTLLLVNENEFVQFFRKNSDRAINLIDLDPDI
jgi:hypothetical protein